LATETSPESELGPNCTVDISNPAPDALRSSHPLLTGSTLPDGRLLIHWHGVDSITAQWRDLSGRTITQTRLHPGEQILDRQSALLCAEGAVLFFGLGLKR
jgi:hypothetical protein